MSTDYASGAWQLAYTHALRQSKETLRSTGFGVHQVRITYTTPHNTTPHLTSPHLTSPHLTPPHPTPNHPTLDTR